MNNAKYLYYALFAIAFLCTAQQTLPSKKPLISPGHKTHFDLSIPSRRAFIGIPKATGPKRTTTNHDPFVVPPRRALTGTTQRKFDKMIFWAIILIRVMKKYVIPKRKRKKRIREKEKRRKPWETDILL